MKVIGIDPGIATTGYGLVSTREDGSLDLIEYGVVQTTPQDNTSQRLLQLYQRLNEIVLLHQPQSGAVEKLFFQRNVRTAFSVGQARGVVMLVLAELGLSVYEYTPLEIKQAVVGYGAADKRQVQQMVKVLLDLQEIPQPDDAADALAIAICHIHSIQMKALSDQS